MAGDTFLRDYGEVLVRGCLIVASFVVGILRKYGLSSSPLRRLVSESFNLFMAFHPLQPDTSWIHMPLDLTTPVSFPLHLREGGVGETIGSSP